MSPPQPGPEADHKSKRQIQVMSVQRLDPWPALQRLAMNVSCVPCSQASCGLGLSTWGTYTTHTHTHSVDAAIQDSPILIKPGER